MKNHLLPGAHGPIKAGTTILEEQPFAFILSAKEQGFRCDHCFAKGKVLKCSGCQYIHYCSRSCQKDAWPQHKAECNGYRKVLPRVPPDAARLMARLIRKLASGGSHQRGHYTKTSFRVWKDLMSHYHELKVDNRRMEHFTSLCAVLFQFLTDISLPNSVELMGIYGRMCVNGFSILDPEMLSIGTGIYLGASVLDHSCDPNAVAVFDGTTINIRTLKDMPTLDWSKIFISYIDLLNTPLDRQTELQMTYYFLCQCSLCLDPHQISLMHAAQCPNKGCDYPVQIPWRDDIKIVIRDDESKSESIGETSQIKDNIQNGGNNHKESTVNEPETNKGPKTNDDNHEEPYNVTNIKSLTSGCDNINNADFKLLSNGFRAMSVKSNGFSNGDYVNDFTLECPKCKEEITKEFVKKFIEVMDFTYLHLQNMRDKSISYVDVCRSCLEKQEGVLHPLSLFHVQTLDLAMDGCLQYEFWDQAMKYASLLLPGFKNFYGDLHPMYGLLLVKLGKLQLYAEKWSEASVSLGAAAAVLRITHGSQHPLWRDSLAPLVRQAEAEASAVLLL